MTAGATSPVDEVVDLLRQLRLPHMRNTAADLLATAKAQRWDPAEAVRACSPKSSPAGKPRRSTHGARPPGSRQARPSTPGTRPSARSPHRPSGLYAPWNGSHRGENVVVCGPSGTGKTHFLEALGHPAIDAGHHVSWFSLEASAPWSAPPRRRHVTRAIERIIRADADRDRRHRPAARRRGAAEALYRVVDAAYEKRSIAVSSNLHPAGFDELMPKTLATATVDRLMHHAHVVLTAGDSIRLTEATAGKGVTPRTH